MRESICKPNSKVSSAGDVVLANPLKKCSESSEPGNAEDEVQGVVHHGSCEWKEEYKADD